MKSMNTAARRLLVRNFKKAKSRWLFLDYDGTLVPHMKDPSAAAPPAALLKLLTALLQDNRTRIVIISGRDRKILDKWFGHSGVEMAAEHGLLCKGKNRKWQTAQARTHSMEKEKLSSLWKR
jgi:trehalose 6-phosphate synthase/phosphatase